jgi:hypothetical protein
LADSFDPERASLCLSLWYLIARNNVIDGNASEPKLLIDNVSRAIIVDSNDLHSKSTNTLNRFNNPGDRLVLCIKHCAAHIKYDACDAHVMSCSL